MRVKRLRNGNLLVPMTATGPGIIGDGAVELGPDSPDYDSWLRWIERNTGRFIDERACFRILASRARGLM